MADQRRNRHGDRIWYRTDDGRVRTMPREWTDLAALDAFQVVSNGRAYFRPDDLIRLATLLDKQRPLLETSGEGAS